MHQRLTTIITETLLGLTACTSNVQKTRYLEQGETRFIRYYTEGKKVFAIDQDSKDPWDSIPVTYYLGKQEEYHLRERNLMNTENTSTTTSTKTNPSYDSQTYP